jgi:cysteine desulfurase family protein (TIGR01976 family)
MMKRGMVRMNFKFDVKSIRKQFPACQRMHNGFPVAYLDGPGGSQVPTRVANKISDYLLCHNANEHGAFQTSAESDMLYAEAREVVADFLGCEAGEVAFGFSSTQNNFNLAFAIGRDLKPGDEIVITDIDHRCNRSPWLALKDKGIVVKSVAVNKKTQQIDLDDLKAKLSSKTKVAAFNWASNALGTISDVKKMCALAHEVGAITVVDAVHYAAHSPIDVKLIDTDVLICSAYKWFGPHLGVIYLKKDLLDRIQFYNVQTEDLIGIRKFHFGTPPFELICGAAEAVEFIASVGEDYEKYFTDELKGLEGRRRNVVAGMLAIEKYEDPMAVYLRTELRKLNGVTIYGPAEGQPRTSTIIFTIDGKKPSDVCKVLGDHGINTWDGDFYAVEVVNDVLGLKDVGGLIRIGLAPYNTIEDIERTIEIIKEIVKSS